MLVEKIRTPYADFIVLQFCGLFALQIPTAVFIRSIHASQLSPKPNLCSSRIYSQSVSPSSPGHIFLTDE